MIKNFKEIAAKILNREIQGTFILKCGYRYTSDNLKLEIDPFGRGTMFYSLDHNTYDLEGRIMNCGKESDSPWSIVEFIESRNKPEPLNTDEQPIRVSSNGQSTYILTLHRSFNGRKLCDERRSPFGNVNTARGTMLTEYFKTLDRLDSDWCMDTQFLDGPDNATITIHNFKNGDFYSYIWIIRKIDL